ncbi:integrase [Sinorhizobium meliloti]|nr:integrase [Sinorhizobium meliloti]
MTDEFNSVQSEKLCKLYSRYREALDQAPTDGQWMPYRWWTLRDELNVCWMTYSQMLNEYASELANIINDLTHHVNRLRAWDKVVVALDVDEKLDAAHEFVDMLGTVAMGLPYAIKSRFAFAAGHLCHQANLAADGERWKDDFPTKNLYLNDIEPYCAKWRRYRGFKLRVEPIAGRNFKEASADFRNVYNHGFSSRFLIGMTATVKRIAKGGSVSYAFGGNEPLGVGEVANLLEIERNHCYQAFDAFQRLVKEQIAAIAAVQAGGTAASGGRLTDNT